MCKYVMQYTRGAEIDLPSSASNHYLEYRTSSISVSQGAYHDEFKAAEMNALSLTPAVLSHIPPHPALEEVTPARDRGLFADPAKSSLLAQASAIEELTPYIGTELKGVQLNKLNATQKDELALLVAEVCMHISKLFAVNDLRRGASSSSVIKISLLTSNMSSRRTTVWYDRPRTLNTVVYSNLSQQDRDPNQQDPKHVTIIGRDGYVPDVH